MEKMFLLDNLRLECPLIVPEKYEKNFRLLLEKFDELGILYTFEERNVEYDKHN